MALKSSGPRRPRGGKISREDIDRLVARARKERDELLKSYREQSLRIHPWVCARCGREFTMQNLHLLTVHHKDHNHNNNPPDGSNWENLCIYCHDNEHSRYLDYEAGGGSEQREEKKSVITQKPFAKLADLLKTGKS
jgi:5-methylcytosine-specific restriction endonuclease McrA